MSSRRAFGDWLLRRGTYWLAADDRLAAARRRRRLTPDEALDLASDYRELAADMAFVRTAGSSPRARDFVEGLAAGLHAELHRRRVRPLAAIRQLLLADFPVAMHALRGHLAVVTASFLLAAAAGWLLVSAEPAAVGLVASEDMIETVQRGELWTDGLLTVVPSSLLSVQIFTNNIVVALTTCCLGIFFVLGTGYIVALNGFMLGATFAYTSQHDLGLALLRFVTAHGPVELSVIVVSGAVGVTLGEAVFRPGDRSRAAALAAAGARAASVMTVCLVFLVGAGLIEGYLSPDPTFPWWARITVGIGYWIVFAGCVTRGWSRAAAGTAG